MNKYEIFRSCYDLNNFRRHLLNIMRVLIILLSFGLSSAYATSSYAQTKIDINMKDASLVEFFKEIQRDTEFVFFYKDDVLKNDVRISINLKKASIDEILQNAFLNTSFAYKISDKQVVIKKLLKKSEVSNLKDKQETITVSGTITETETGMPVPAANILEKGTSNGVMSDFDGNFSIEVPEDAVLKISYIGYATQEIKVNGRKEIDIVLETDAAALDEVVVVGYGTQKKRDLTGAVSSINAEELNTESNVNIGQALQGKLAGVNITSAGGAPGGGNRIMIRGIGTLNNAEPLYIVDGIYMNSMNNINPSDVKSIDVLKDASSAAIYGSRAANGVVIITTKSGSYGQKKPVINATANFGVQTPSKYLDMLNAERWANVSTVAREAIGLDPLKMAENFKDKPNNDWQEIMLRSASIQKYNVTIRGGGKYITNYTSLGYLNQDGVVKGTEYKRFNAQVKTEYKKDWLKLGNNIIFTNQKDKPLYSYSRGGHLGIILQGIPTLPKYDPENEAGGYGRYYGNVVDMPNPLGLSDDKLMNRTWDEKKIFLNFYAELTLPLGLSYRLNVTPDYSDSRSTNYENIYDFGRQQNTITSMTDSQYKSQNLLVENLLNFEEQFGKHKITALLGYSYQNFKNRYIMASGRGLPEGIYEVGAATQDRLNDAYSNESSLTSIISRAFYSYDNRYLITATYRRDGSSKFRKVNRYGDFPSVSLGWNIANEKFMENLSWLDQLKLRGGYGILGNQEIDNYMYTSVVTSNINYPDGEGGIYLGAFPKNFSNPNIKWEETAMTNVGVDISILANRLNFTGDWFVKNTKDILLSVPIPISTGGANDPVRNAGEIKNKGFEFSLNWNDQPTEDFSYDITLTGDFLKNEVTKMGTANQIIHGGSNRTNVTTTRTMEGYPIGGFWLIPTQGLFQNQEEINDYNVSDELIQPNAKPGDIKFADTNSDGEISDDDRVYMGSPFPSSTFSLNFRANYKQFDLSIGLQSVIGNKIYNATRLELEGVNKGANYLNTVLDYWTEENPDASFPRLVWDDPNQNSRPQSDRYLEDGDFFRVRNIQLGYSFSDEILKKTIQNLRIYVSIENLATITNYSGYTPDVDGGGSSTSRGFDNFVYPTNKNFMLGVDFTF